MCGIFNLSPVQQNLILIVFASTHIHIGTCLPGLRNATHILKRLKRIGIAHNVRQFF